MSTELAPVEKKKSDHPPYQVHYLGDRVLRQPAKRVNKVDAEVRQTIRQMLQTMYSLDGIGLAAPQVGIHKQIVVVDTHPDDGATAPLIMINPEIHGYSQDLSIMEEGCLSIPEFSCRYVAPRQSKSHLRMNMDGYIPLKTMTY